jgi:hypothetical protein
MFVRAEAADVIRFDAAVDRCAHSLTLLGDDRTEDSRRAASLGYLADPQRAFDLYTDAATAAGVTLEPAPDTGLKASGHDSKRIDSQRTDTQRVDTRPPVTLYVHLTDDAVLTGRGVARVERVGPVTLDRVRDWLTGAQVSLKPVIDLADQTPVDSYQTPPRLAEALTLRTPADCFPHATATITSTNGRFGDIDHTIPYRPPDHGGPPGQTNLGNLGPLTRFHHRIKTHSHWQVKQVWPGVYAWRSPHGHHTLVDHTGTHRATPAA